MKLLPYPFLWQHLQPTPSHPKATQTSHPDMRKTLKLVLKTEMFRRYLHFKLSPSVRAMTSLIRVRSVACFQKFPQSGWRWLFESKLNHEWMFDMKADCARVTSPCFWCRPKKGSATANISGGHPGDSRIRALGGIGLDRFSN